MGGNRPPQHGPTLTVSASSIGVGQLGGAARSLQEICKSPFPNLWTNFHLRKTNKTQSARNASKERSLTSIVFMLITSALQ